MEVTDAEGRGVPRLTITQAHPGGLARLYTEAPTRLSSLIREKASLARAMERARAMMARSLQLSTRHGVGRVHLSIGQVQWHRDGHTVRSAALLKPVRLDDVGGDVMITLEPGALMDPDLEAALREHGEHCDAEAILDGARSSHGFSASVALSLLRERVGVLDGVEVRDELVLATEGFSGAEIEQAVVASLFDAFSERRDIRGDDLRLAVERSVPVSVTQAESLAALRA